MERYAHLSPTHNIDAVERISRADSPTLFTTRKPVVALAVRQVPSVATKCRGSSVAEQLIRNQQVAGSSPALGSMENRVVPRHHTKVDIRSANHGATPLAATGFDSLSCSRVTSRSIADWR